VEVGRRLQTPIKLSGMAAQTGPISFSTPFSVETINSPRYGKVKMPIMDMYDGITDPKEHLGVHKAQIYIQDVDDAAYCRYFPTTLKRVVQSWFNGLASRSVSCFQHLVNRFFSQSIASCKERRTSIHLSKINQRHRSPWRSFPGVSLGGSLNP